MKPSRTIKIDDIVAVVMHRAGLKPDSAVAGAIVAAWCEHFITKLDTHLPGIGRVVAETYRVLDTSDITAKRQSTHRAKIFWRCHRKLERFFPRGNINILRLRKTMERDGDEDYFLVDHVSLPPKSIRGVSYYLSGMIHDVGMKQYTSSKLTPSFMNRVQHLLYDEVDGTDETDEEGGLDAVESPVREGPSLVGADTAIEPDDSLIF